MERMERMEKIRKLANLFKINGKPFELSDGQLLIFDEIIRARHPRVQIIAPTQYGKSISIALAVILRAMTYKEDFIILAPTESKAQIIMGYIIEHLFDDAIFIDQLEFDNVLDYSSRLEMLKRYRSKDRISFKDGGSVRTLTLNARTSKSIESAMGFGGNRLILDESSLIDDSLYAGVKRMLGGYTDYSDTFLLEIGNPFYRNHFLRTWIDDDYHHIFIDYHQALKEGRYSQQFIDEMSHEAFFDIFYKCEFPREDEIDSKGYRRLMSVEDIKKKMKKIDRVISENEIPKLGIDVGGGGAFNSFCIRTEHRAWLEEKNRVSDTMYNVSKAIELMEKYNIEPDEVYIDDIGIGRGVTDRLKELGFPINAVSVGGIPQDKTRFANIKAENCWEMREWLSNSDNCIDDDGDFTQISWIKYKISSDRQIVIQSKDDLKQETGKSPDFAESFMLTFSVKARKARAFTTKAF